MTIESKKRMKKVNMCLIFFILFSSDGCARDSPRRITLTIWSAPTGVEEKSFKRLCARFEREHPDIAIHNVGGSNEEKLIRAVVAGVPPDLAYIYGPSIVGPMAANHAVMTLDGYFRRDGLRETDFLPAAIAQGRYKGHLYAMPVTRDSRGFYWNKAVFRKAGLDPERPPATLESLEQLALRLTKRKPDGSLQRLGFLPPGDSAVFFFVMGGRFYDERTGRLTLDCPENVAALKWLIKIVDALGGRNRVAAFNAGLGRGDSAMNPLAHGDVAMTIDGEWYAMHLAKFANFSDYGVAEIPSPAGRPHLRNMAWQDGDVMMIPVGARHPDAAWEFMRWMQEARQQEEYAVLMNNLPSIRALMNSPALTSGSKQQETLGFIMRRIASNARNAHFFPTLPVTRLYRDALDNAVEVAELHQKTPEQALADAQRRVERELSRYR